MSSADTDRPLHEQPLAAGANDRQRESAAATRPGSSRAARPVAARSGAERVPELARKRGPFGVRQTDFALP